MELEFLENTKSKIVVRIKGEDHTFCNIIVKELQNNSNVKSAAYRIEHPLQKVPELLVETNEKTTAKKAILDAVAKISKTNEKFLKDFKSQAK
jgi:DNA-directed RNA polymerase subunit L